LAGVLLASAGLAAVPEFARGSAWLAAIGPTVPLVGIAVALVAFRGVLIEAGQRSQRFRNERVRRQRIPSLLAGIGVTVAGWIALGIATVQEADLVATVATVVAAIGSLFVVIGAWYLVANAWWIRSSLVDPPPRLADLFEPSAEAGRRAQ